MYISAAEFNMIISALTFAADRVLESKGEIEAIERAHDFIGDLWLDNERHGDHYPDGTFNAGK